MTAATIEWLISLGAPDGPHPAPVTSVESWLAAASERAEWTLWGKAMPDSPCPAHPLLCHLLDVAAVAAHLLIEVVPPALKRRLLAIHPDEREALRALLIIIALHDLGKATPGFQGKVEWAKRLLPALGFDLGAGPNARHHGDIGYWFLSRQLKELGVEPALSRKLARAVAAHHGQFPLDTTVASAPGPDEAGRLPHWGNARAGVVEALVALFGSVRWSELRAVDHAYIVQLAGLTSVADWVGSMAEVFVYEPPHLSAASYWLRALERAQKALRIAGLSAHGPAVPRRSFSELFPKYNPWPLHQLADRVSGHLGSPSLIVIEAPMGEGKTEASLTLSEAAASSGQQGLYIGLPTQATANQMFKRIRAFLEQTRTGRSSSLLLAHGEASLVEAFRVLLSSVWDRERDDKLAPLVRADTWFLSRKRTLLAEFAVGTIDQALLAAMLIPHAFVRLFGLAGKTVVLDEVHAYDTYTGTLLDRLLEWLAACGTTVVLLSATLPSRRRKQLIEAYVKGAGHPSTEAAPTPYPRLTVASSTGTLAHGFSPRSTGAIVELTLATDDMHVLAERVVATVANGGVVGWICNTVQRAQDAYAEVRAIAPDVARLLLHARLLPEERAKREDRLESWLGPQARGATRPNRCVVVGTQVLEQSLDVDFDLIVTDIAPIDLVLQRAGRLWRHRRTDRSASQPRPRLWVVSPPGSWKDAPIDAIAGIYAELFVRRSLRMLERHRELRLPEDIEPWVEDVYAHWLRDDESELSAAFENCLGKDAAKAMHAKSKVMKSPLISDDIFGELKVMLNEDDDPALHPQLRAATRLGEESLELVCLEKRDGHVVVGDDDPTPLDFDAVPDRETVARLVRRSIGVSSKRIVAPLKADRSASPPGWDRSALLRYRKAVVFEEGRAVIGDHELRLDEELGLVIGSPRAGGAAVMPRVRAKDDEGRSPTGGEVGRA